MNSAFWVLTLATTVLVIGIHKILHLAHPDSEAQRRWGWVRTLNAVLLALASATLAATAIPAVFRGELLSGLPLLLHVAAASIFIVTLLLYSLFELFDPPPAATRVVILLSLLAGLATLVPMLLSMQTWASTEQLLLLAEIHATAGCLFVNLLLVRSYLALIGRTRLETPSTVAVTVEAHQG